MTRVAIIGTGVAGLGCAHFLHPRFDITLYEQNDYAGGHTNTVTANEGGGGIPIDTGFMVYNEVTYPNLTRLFRELDVKSKPAPMSFSVKHEPTGLEYNGLNFNTLFSQRRNLVNVRFIRMLLTIGRFFRDSTSALRDPELDIQTVGQFVEQRGYGKDFLDLYLLPMSSAVWSTPPGAMLEFPALSLLRFFYNHGFLGVQTHHPWRTVVNGAKSYVEKLVAPFRDKIRLGIGARRVTREEGARALPRVTGRARSTTKSFSRATLIKR